MSTCVGARPVQAARHSIHRAADEFTERIKQVLIERAKASTNIDIRNFSINYEINAVLYDQRLAQELEASFVQALACCTEFDAEEYSRRSAVMRLRDSAARLFSLLL